MGGVLTSIDPEQAAIDLQYELLANAPILWPGEKLTPLDVCDPWVAARHRGFVVQEGWLTGARDGFKLGGFIDRVANVIAIAEDLKPRTKLFTLAHELGHMIMHRSMQHHREIPLHGITEPRVQTDQRELEANNFAGCFLVPRRQLFKAFKDRFGDKSLKFNENIGFDLIGNSYTALRNAPYPSDAFERVVATTDHFQGGRFVPLHDLFRVSPTTMAIRLRECGLVYR
jgi:hypothetical protein